MRLNDRDGGGEGEENGNWHTSGFTIMSSKNEIWTDPDPFSRFVCSVDLEFLYMYHYLNGEFIVR